MADEMITAAILTMNASMPSARAAVSSSRTARHQGDKQNRAGRERQRQIVEQKLPAAQVPPLAHALFFKRQEQPGGAARQLQVIKTDPRELGECDGEQREIDARDAESKAEPANHGAKRRHHCDRRKHAEPWTDPELEPHERRHIAADADIKRMAKRKLARIAHHQIPRLPHIGEVEDEREHGQHVAVRRQRQSEESGERQRDHDPPAWGHAAPQLDHRRCPIRPCGRSTSTAINSANENLLSIPSANRKPASASETPISTPPTSAPAIDPMPPMMTMMKAMSV